ncbi:unnamed protein product [Pieris macdunnoughi]|uniref:Uncharacterized protein n=1 Tax=Pieris macdunnoughi TaxID=345717 RepID=A0A821X8N0_9NEOP|nr:unnamed protein product [Pieris macdunnoughi]
MKFLLLCLLAAYCYADDSSEALLSKIEEHQMTLRVWEEDNSRLLSTLIEEQKKYDNAKKNEVVLLQTVDYLLKTNMEMLENVLTGLKKIQMNLSDDHMGEDGLETKNGDIREVASSNNYETDSDARTLQWIKNLGKSN